MGAADVDIHDRIHDEIRTRRRSLESGAPASPLGEEAWTGDEISRTLAELDADLKLLLAHWKTGGRMTTGYPLAKSEACGNPQPCPHVLGLATKYGLIAGA